VRSLKNFYQSISWCLIKCLIRLGLSHAGNGGSNPPGDAKKIKDLREIVSPFFVLPDLFLEFFAIAFDGEPTNGSTSSA